MGLTNFPVDIVLLGMIAAFLVLRLRSVLGRREGFEPESSAGSRTGARTAAGRVIDVRAEAVRDPVPVRQMPEADSPAGQGMARVRAIDPHFNPQRFLEGAETAFRLIVIAFAKGDRATLRPLLTASLMEVFDHAITERDAAGHTQHTTVHALRSAVIEAAAVNGTLADISVRFVSDQVSYSNNAEGQTVHRHRSPSPRSPICGVSSVIWAAAIPPGGSRRPRAPDPCLVPRRRLAPRGQRDLNEPPGQRALNEPRGQRDLNEPRGQRDLRWF